MRDNQIIGFFLDSQLFRNIFLFITDSKSQRSDQESTSKSESETKGKEEVTAQKSSTEESDGQSSSKTDTNINTQLITVNSPIHQHVN